MAHGIWLEDLGGDRTIGVLLAKREAIVKAVSVAHSPLKASGGNCLKG